jgi:hypothetical protein
MSSPAQVLANRRNSFHSTGPVTAAGKAVASRNATRHGLTSKHLILPGEDAAEYDAHRDSLVREYAPATETECTLVEEVAAGAWRLARARRHETAILKNLIGEFSKDSDKSFANVFIEEPKHVDRLYRYITTIERSYYRALNKLETLQKLRKTEEKETAVVRAWAGSPRTAKPANGFVSQTAAKRVEQPLPQQPAAAHAGQPHLEDAQIESRSSNLAAAG